MKNMVRKIPIGACPICGKSQFMVVDTQVNYFLTNYDGEVVDSKEKSHIAKGICLTCHNEIQMLPTTYGYVPLTELRKILFKVPIQETPKAINTDGTECNKNPMEAVR